MERFEPGPIPCEGAVFGDFRLTSHLPPDAAPATIERDRLHMAARPGFNRKVLPLLVDPATGTAWCGGRYLFRTYPDAVAYAKWVQDDFALDGTRFLDRPDFVDPAMRAWRVLAAEDFKNIRSDQHVVRTEIWSLAEHDAVADIAACWSDLREEAIQRGHSALWLLHDDRLDEISLITIGARAPDADQSDLDFRSIRTLGTEPSLGMRWDRDGLARPVHDRTYWVFTIWFPRIDGKDLAPPVWPNSPPLPAP